MAKLRVSEVNKKIVFKLSELIDELPLSHVYNALSHSEMVDLFVYNKLSLMNIESSKLLTFIEDNEIIGFLSITKEAWDSNFFGFEIYNLNDFWYASYSDRLLELMIEEVFKFCVTKNVNSLRAKFNLNDISKIQFFENNGFRTMDVHGTYVFDYKRNSIPEIDYDDIRIRDYIEADLDPLVNLAESSYSLGRYYSDTHLSKKLCDKFHGSWIANSCNGNIADNVIVAEKNGKPIGYTTLKYDKNFDGLCEKKFGRMILSAVDPRARENKVYTKMIHYGLKWLQSEGADYASLGTQINNIPVQKSWASLGFKISKTGIWLYKWF